MGLACEDMAHDIKFNLQKQSHQLQNGILAKLYAMQGETTMAHRLINVIKKERLKNKVVLYSVTLLLLSTMIYILYTLLFT